MMTLNKSPNRPSNSQILLGKRAMVFGAGGSIGGAVAKEFAAEGAEVFLSGRTKSNVGEVQKQIVGAGGGAHAAGVDAPGDAAGGADDDRIPKRGRICIPFYYLWPAAT